MQVRIAEVTVAPPWLVFEAENEVGGYAYAIQWRARAPYRHTDLALASQFALMKCRSSLKPDRPKTPTRCPKARWILMFLNPNPLV